MVRNKKFARVFDYVTTSTVNLQAAPFMELVDNGSAGRRRDRRLRDCWRHEQVTAKMVLATARHRSAVRRTMERRERDISCRHSEEDSCHKAIDEGLDCLAWDVTKNVWWQWCFSATMDILNGQWCPM